MIRDTRRSGKVVCISEGVIGSQSIMSGGARKREMGWDLLQKQLGTKFPLEG